MNNNLHLYAFFGAVMGASAFLAAEKLQEKNNAPKQEFSCQIMERTQECTQKIL